MKMPSNSLLFTGILACVVLLGGIKYIQNKDTVESPNWNLKTADKVFEEYYKTPVYCVSQYPRKGITLRWCARTRTEFNAMKTRMKANGDLTSDMIIDSNPSYPRPVK